MFGCRRRFRDLRGKEKGQQEISFCNPTDWGEAGADCAARGQFVLGITRLLPPLTVIICVCLSATRLLSGEEERNLPRLEPNEARKRHTDEAQGRPIVQARPSKASMAQNGICQRGRTFIPRNTHLARWGSRR